MSRTWLPKLWKQIIGSTTRSQPRSRKPRHTRLAVEGLEDRRLPSTFHVLDLSDSASDPGSLRAVLTAANATPGSNVIDFTNPKTGKTLSGTITLTSGEELVISNRVTINGPGAVQLAISGNSSFPGFSPSRVFQVEPGANAKLKALTIANGGNYTHLDGGGILNQGVLALYDCDLLNNTARCGGGIYNESSGVWSCIISNCTFDGNWAWSCGGGLFNESGECVISKCNFGGLATVGITALASNTAGSGGGIYNEGSAKLYACKVTGNRASIDGGGIENTGTLWVALNSVVSGNEAGYDGGGIFNESGIAEVAFSVIQGNRAANVGGGIQNESSGRLSVYGASVIKGNTAYAGGGIDNLGTASVSGGSSILANDATWRGGGIINEGYVTISNSDLNGNTAGSNGGGIANFLGRLDIEASVVEYNTTVHGGDGGGLYNYSGGTAVVENGSVFQYNSAATGAGIDNLATLTVTNSTFNHNHAGWNGGGIANWATADILASVFEYNSAGNDGGGVYTNSPDTIRVWLPGYVSDTFEYDHANNDGGGFYNSGAWVFGVRTLNFVRGTNSAAYGSNIWDFADLLGF
jgi:predicted outer membrane repeat protein